jgi:hypothetical protein
MSADIQLTVWDYHKAEKNITKQKKSGGLVGRLPLAGRCRGSAVACAG